MVRPGLVMQLVEAGGLNMLYVAFLTFVYSLVCLLMVSRFTVGKPRDQIIHLVLAKGPLTPIVAIALGR